MSRRYGAAILGAGPAGLYLALSLLRSRELDGPAIVIERESFVGGLASSFVHEGLSFDLGSHRLHPSIAPHILADLEVLLDGGLVYRPRNGRIRLLGRYVSFPISLGNMARRLPARFVAGVMRDALAKPWRKGEAPSSFADALRQGLGPTICESFYFPYARKLWGLEPNRIAVLQAEKRVSGRTIGRILKRIVVARTRPGAPGTGFYYPDGGFGRISASIAAEVERLGGKIERDTTVAGLRRLREDGWRVGLETTDGGAASFDAGLVFSTLPVSALARALGGEVPIAARAAFDGLRYRGMLLVYLVLDVDRFTPFDAHYFPSEDVVFSRLSEPKNYAASPLPPGRTGLCVEIPATPGDELWNLEGHELVDRVLTDLRKVALPADGHVVGSLVRRLPSVYPVYDLGVERRMSEVESFLDTLPYLVSLGRQALFLHDNTHHTLEAAWLAASCVRAARFDHERWRSHRARIQGNVVED